MKLRDFIRLIVMAIFCHRLRAFLTMLCIAIGIAAVVLLTSIGEGIHRFVLSEFTQFGTNLIGINPGRATTVGASVGVFGAERPLTIDDAEALKRIANVEAVIPMVQGNAEIKAFGKSRRSTVYGVGAEFPTVFTFNVSAGRFLPDDDPLAPRAYAVLGYTLKNELFGTKSPLGQYIRIGGSRYRVIGTLESKGQVLGFDLDDAVYIPTQRSLAMFNRDSVMEIDLLYKEGANQQQIVGAIEKLIIARHGKMDVTITTQQQMLEILGSILNVLTFAVGALGGISLLVGGVGILTITTIAVRERTSEIGLYRALGARRIQILALFLGEAAILSGLGGVIGLAVGLLGGQLLQLIFPALPTHFSLFFTSLSVILAIIIGLIAGVLPAMHAAQLDPVTALRAE
ncbi:MAG: FtsX-like permease family protein [Gammaproteobacteria bacterium]|nr:FtsX-like permease family protein [Gammaproteobacteria bacterium]